MRLLIDKTTERFIFLEPTETPEAAYDRFDKRLLAQGIRTPRNRFHILEAFELKSLKLATISPKRRGGHRPKSITITA